MNIGNGSFLKRNILWIYFSILACLIGVIGASEDQGYQDKLANWTCLYILIGSPAAFTYKASNIPNSKINIKHFHQPCKKLSIQEPVRLACGLRLLDSNTNSDCINKLLANCGYEGNWSNAISLINKDLIIHSKVEETTIRRITLGE